SHRRRAVRGRRVAQPARPPLLGNGTKRGRQPAARHGEGAVALMAIFVLFGAVMVLVLLNVPIAIALGVVALVAILHTGGLAALATVPLVMYTGSTSFPLLAIPPLLLSGPILNPAGRCPRPVP